MNTDKDNPNASGFKMYIAENNELLTKKNTQLGSFLAEAINKDYQAPVEIIQVKRGIEVLTHSAIPAIIVECGYLTNDKDLAFITDEKNQEKSARDILEGIVKFEQNNISYQKEIRASAFT